jgi:hypothetical protein
MPSEEGERGILSESNRQFLLDDSGYKEASKSSLRSRIRSRIRAGIEDFQLIYDQFRGEAFRQTVYPAESQPPSSEAIRDGIAFLYKAAKENPRIDSEQVIQDGIDKAEHDHGRRARVEIETESIPVEELIERVAGEIPDGDMEYIRTLREVQAMGFEKDEDDPFSHKYRAESTDKHPILWEDEPDAE